MLRSQTDRTLRRSRWLTGAIVALVVLLLPVPWLHLVGEEPLGWAWRLDGRLVVNSELVDPPGRWSWLTVGRPPVVAEVIRDRLIDSPAPARDMRVAPPGSQPQFVEPVAAAVGFLHAGRQLDLGLVIEVAGPQLQGLPPSAIVTHLDGVELRSRADWQRAIDGAGPTIQFQTADGQWWSAPGPSLPYDFVRLIDRSPDVFSASIGGRAAQFAPVAWFRSLSLGNSHGLMVALVSYAHAADEDVARGRHIAGTGGILGDGTVTRISGLRAKAAAARRAGADVLIFPASQADQLEDFERGSMVLLPVESLAEAIAGLRAL